MRDRETIDAELRRIALARRSIHRQGGQPSSREVDELLDELLAHSAGQAVRDQATSPETAAAATSRRHGGALRRAGLLAALPLSLIAVAAAAVMIFFVHQRDSTAPATEPAPSAAPPKAAAPKPPAPRIEMADMAFIAALKHEGVPVPSQDYVMKQGHAVCDFLAQQHNFADAIGFVQRSSIWNAEQSAEVTAGAIVAYCPQSQATAADLTGPAYQNTLSDLQAIEGKLQGIEGKLQGIEGDLQGIQRDLDNIPGHR